MSLFIDPLTYNWEGIWRQEMGYEGSEALPLYDFCQGLDYGNYLIEQSHDYELYVVVFPSTIFINRGNEVTNNYWASIREFPVKTVDIKGNVSDEKYTHRNYVRDFDFRCVSTIISSTDSGVAGASLTGSDCRITFSNTMNNQGIPTGGKLSMQMDLVITAAPASASSLTASVFTICRVDKKAQVGKLLREHDII